MFVCWTNENKIGCLNTYSVLRDDQVRAGFYSKVHLLHEATPSRLEEVAVLSNAQNQQRVKENEEMEEYVPDD